MKHLVFILSTAALFAAFGYAASEHDKQSYEYYCNTDDKSDIISDLKYACFDSEDGPIQRVVPFKHHTLPHVYTSSSDASKFAIVFREEDWPYNFWTPHHMVKVANVPDDYVTGQRGRKSQGCLLYIITPPEGGMKPVAFHCQNEGVIKIHKGT
ncbi:uncharacterized protein UTRI_10235 [Ustilago trichophora]|uniref:Mig1 protein n=1 Tax=Ustilago trichophora TaxID=86804 RepID=A0A5C3EGV6_9BASI|nr:uncharacterized protein UTRI_10235 [Ustilago trichophora]